MKKLGKAFALLTAVSLVYVGGGVFFSCSADGDDGTTANPTTTTGSGTPKPEENPSNPENPDTPDNPDTPENPDNPDTPENPDTPSENPDTPDNPENPSENPDTPDNPSDPDTPDPSENPDNPDDPSDPENPNPNPSENPENPNPENPDDPTPSNPDDPNPSDPENPDTPDEPVVVYPTSIAFTNTGISDGKLTVEKNDIPETGLQLTASVSPENADDQTYTFSVSNAVDSKISVSESGLVTVDSSMEAPETVVITVKANGAENIVASLELTVNAQPTDSAKVERTKAALEAVLDSFNYGNSSSEAKSNAKAFIKAQTLPYSDVKVSSSLKNNGAIEFSIKLGDSKDSIEVQYPAPVAESTVNAAVTSIKSLLSDFAWKTDADTTVSAIEAAITKDYADVKTSVSKVDADNVIVVVANKYIDTAKAEAFKIESPNYEPSVTGDTSAIPVKTNDVKLTVEGNLVKVSAPENAKITWFVDDVKQAETGASFTLPATSKKGVTYEVRVEAEVNGHTYSKSESVMYK